MGERGPTKQPAAQHEANGTYRADRHAGPTLPCVVPLMPPDMCPVAQAKWKQITPQLELAGLISDIDQGVLRRYCESYARYLDAQDAVVREGMTLKSTKETKNGSSETTVINPAYRIVDAETKFMLMVERQFGMTPSARTGISFDSAKDGGSEERESMAALGIVG